MNEAVTEAVASSYSEGQLREATEELASQRSSRDRVLAPLKKVSNQLKRRHTQLLDMQAENERDIQILLAKNVAIDLEAEQITGDLKQLNF